ncbi:flagellar transcriptional regulator FlhD [Enterobacter roggenkampii]|uniref:flagellar transcriptional regulator FlhD n=1 Tax=Enterobacter cloacae complex TaxID=354276 RepID=UPI0009081D37|nr:flagellar transcriptional regulator FlhD [Enterobacter roggenkampii]ELK6460613.1 flagellar transcriptional regulator FlhD [Enterobacter ludwigii]ELW9295939.1 flagellar transcriptional regulator FlhD [Enterobacter roggenkampii]
MYSVSACLTDIHYLNLSYLLLLQRISCTQEASVLAGVNCELLATIRDLPLPKLASLAETNQLIITIRQDILLP